MVRRLLRDVAVIVFAASIAACSPPQSMPAESVVPAPSAQQPISQAAIEETLRDTVAALVAGDATKAGGMYATDAIFLNVRGKFETQAAIETFWAGYVKTGGGKDLVLGETVKSGTSGELAYSVSRFTHKVTGVSGHTVLISERQSDGSLKIVVHMNLPDPPAAK